MSQEQTDVKCPQCGAPVDVAGAVRHQITAELKEQHESQLAQEKTEIDALKKSLKYEKDLAEADRIRQNQQFAEKVSAEVKNRESELLEKARAEAEKENSTAKHAMQNELNQKTEQIKELRTIEAENEKLKREKNEQEATITATKEKEFNAKLAAAEERISKNADEKHEMKHRENEKQNEDLRKLIEEMKRKQEQGSVQLQGEVQELAIEEWLRAQFPHDEIKAIKSGERGADCLQIVNTEYRRNCGTIYYESKRTKSFSAEWISKLKDDMRDREANVGVLVTEAMPPDMERADVRDGVWICSFSEFKILCVALRSHITQLSDAIGIQENKGEKTAMLYDYLTGGEFVSRFEAIVENFRDEQEELEKEKRATITRWNRREKRLKKVLINAASMYGSIQGIAGNAIQSVPLLELPYSETDSDDSDNTDKVDDMSDIPF